jgi:hypothetical protein
MEGEPGFGKMPVQLYGFPQKNGKITHVFLTPVKP